MMRARKCSLLGIIKLVLFIMAFAVWTLYSCNLLAKICGDSCSEISHTNQTDITGEHGQRQTREAIKTPVPNASSTLEQNSTKSKITPRPLEPSPDNTEANAAALTEIRSSGKGQEVSATFYQINDESRYVYSAFLDTRYSTRYIRVFGIQDQEVTSSVVCRIHHKNRTWSDFPPETKYAIYPQWPSAKLKYMAYYYGCECSGEHCSGLSEDISLSLLVKDSHIETPVPISSIGLAQKRDTVAICVKAVWGSIDPYRLVEWVETNRKLGVEKIVMYDGTVTGAAVRVLEYYSRKGIVELVPFTYILNMATFMMKDPMKSRLQNEDYLLEQGYLVSMNDCYYRLRDRFKFILLIDIDEVLVPMTDESLISLIERLEKDVTEASAFIFPVAWHFDEFGQSVEGDAEIPEYMHMQRHLRRTQVMNPANDQPKAVINTDGAVTINWHGVVNIPTNHGFRGNFNVQWKDYGYIHHFRRNCKIKYNDQECDFMMGMSVVDEIMPRFIAVENDVKHVLLETNLL